MRRTRAQGFSLLEAIVALTILSAAMLGAYGWIANDMGALQRVRALALEEAAVREATARLEQLDLSAEPAGSIDWRDFRIAWNAAPVEAPRPGRTSVGGIGLHELTLHAVQLSVYHDGQLIGTPELRMTQYRRKRESRATPP